MMNEIITNECLTVTEISEDLFLNPAVYDRWIQYLDRSPQTVETYTREIRQFFHYLQGRNIKFPTRNDIKDFRDWIKANHKPSTAQNYLMAVKRFYAWIEAETNGQVRNVAKDVNAVKLDRSHKKDYLSPADVAAVLNSIDRTTLTGKRDYAMIALMATTGIRCIEVERANVEDYTTKTGMNSQRVKVLYVQGKGHEEKTDYQKIDTMVADAINEYLEARGKVSGSDALFAAAAHRNTDRMTTRSISRIVKTRLQDAGFDSPRLTAHSLRHTAANLSMEAGASIEETKQLLRHTEITTTYVYAREKEREKNDSEYKISSLIRPHLNGIEKEEPEAQEVNDNDDEIIEAMRKILAGKKTALRAEILSMIQRAS